MILYIYSGSQASNNGESTEPFIYVIYSFIFESIMYTNWSK